MNRKSSVGVLVVGVATALISCDSGLVARTMPTAPTAPPAVGGLPTIDASTFIGDLIGVMQAHSVNTDRIDWPRVRKEMTDLAGHASTVGDLFPAIEHALRSLNDYESYYTFNRQTVGPAPVGGCRGAVSARPLLPDSIGYVKVDGCNCQGTAATAYASAIQRAIRAADRPALEGWIVDLRGNSGGNMWPMIAGVGPVLGEGIIGYIIYNNRDYEREYVRGGAQSFGEIFTQVAEPYALMSDNPNVAVLTDGGTVSAGEAMTVWFKARPGTRSFGTATCGHHHLLQDFSVRSGGALSLVTAHNADRTRRTYAGPIDPDEIVTDPNGVVSRAAAWLRSVVVSTK